MPLSRYLKLFSLEENPEQVLAFSCRRGSSALLPAGLVRALEQGEKVPADTLATLERLAFTTPDPGLEQEEVFSFNRELNRLATTLSVALILNLDCNFQCRYCYEGSQKEKIYLDDETAHRFVAFIRKMAGPEIKKVNLDLYGGEPLLSLKRIVYLAEALRPSLEKRGITLEITLVTNGSLLSPAAVKALLPLGLTSCKVTLDGPADNHNFFRPFRGGAPSFDRIIGNIKECCSLVKIGVGGNYTRDNYHLFPQLLDDLERQGLTPDKLAMVKFDPVLQTTDRFSDSRFCGGCLSINEPWLAHASLLLHEAIIKRGYKTPKISPSPCMIDLEKSFTVNYDGTLYKCLAMIGHQDYACGDIWQGMGDYARIYHLDHWQKEEKCRQCSYLPLCFGGCRYMAFQRTGSMAEVDCQKDYFDAVLEPLVKQDLAG